MSYEKQNFVDGQTLIAEMPKPFWLGSAGSKSKEIVTSDCYFFIPSAIEVSSSMIDEPYVYEGQTISYMTGNESRIKRARQPSIGCAARLQLMTDTSMQSRRLASCTASIIPLSSWV